MQSTLRFAAVLIFAVSAFAQRISVVEDEAAAGKQAIETRVVLENAGDDARSVAADNTFYNGERVRLRVSSDRDAYLYALCENSQGSLAVLFPNRFSQAASRVRKGRSLSIPEASWFQFDDTPGTEHVYILLARRPISDLERGAGRDVELTRALLDRYTRLAPGEAKGIVLAVEDNEITVLRLDLRHAAR